MSTQRTLAIDWHCKHTWYKASKNTFWCLLGCCIGDFGTIGYFQFMGIDWPVVMNYDACNYKWYYYINYP